MTATILNSKKQNLACFFDRPSNCRVLQEDRNKVLLKTEDPENALFIKIFKYPELIASRFQYGRFSGGNLELKNCFRLARKGIRTPEPIGSAVKRNRLGFPVQSLYAARWVKDSFPLPVYMDRGLAGRLSSGFSMERFVENLGVFVGKINRQGIYSTDFNVRNFLVTQRTESEKNGSEEIFLVDYERLFFRREVKLKGALVGLSHIGAHLVYVDPELIFPFCTGFVRQYSIGIPCKAFADLVMTASLKKKEQWDRGIAKKFDRIARHMSQKSSSKG